MMTEQEFLAALPEKVLIDGDWSIREIYVAGKLLRPELSQQVHNHSPDGFNWGFGGSGPAQFALALLMKYVDPKTAQQYYHDLKFGWVAGLPQSDFECFYNLMQVMKDILDKKRQSS